MSETTVPPYPACPFRDRTEGRWHLIRILPLSEEPPTRDPFEPGDPDHGFWLAYTALADWVHKPLKGVWQTFCELSMGEDPRALFASVLFHPETPFGLGFKWDWVHPRHNVRGRRWQMHVVFRGQCFVRTDDGALYKTDDRFDWWFTDPEFCARMRREVRETGWGE